MPVSAKTDANWFGQPRGLTILFLTEMWEVFSTVGMRTLLIYYVTRELRFAQPQASMIYGVYTATVYLTPLAGGVVVDRWLGRRRGVVLGGGIMALGHFALMVPALVFPALALIAIGNGLFLPSLASQIGNLYADDDPRRAGAYNVYYVGKNLGALIAPLICGTLGETLGWHWGFAAAGVGMCVSVAVFIAGRREIPDPPPRPARSVAVAGPRLGDAFIRRLTLLVAIGLFVVLFRAAYEQTGNTLALWIAHGVDRRILGGEIRTTWFQAINPALVFLLTPVLIARWTRQARRGREPAPIRKMAMGAGFLAAAYLLLSAATLAAGPRGQVHWLWVVGHLVLLTLGELFLIPTGLGLFSQLAPSSLTATMIAAWYLTSFGGNLAAGVLGAFWSRFEPQGFFLLLAGLAGASAILLVLVDRPSRSFMTPRRPVAARC